MKTIKLIITLLHISLFCCLCNSCSSIEQTTESEFGHYGVEKTHLILSSSKCENLTTSIVPRYVFEDKDKMSLYIQEDTISPKYHLKLNSQNQKACNDIINLAYYNNFNVELKYDVQNLEVCSIRLNIAKNRTRAEDSFIIPTGEIEVEKTNLETNDWLNCYANCCGQESTGQRYLINVTPFASYFYLNCDAKSFEYAKKILETAEKRKLNVGLKYICDTKDIVKIKILPAYKITENKVAPIIAPIAPIKIRPVHRTQENKTAPSITHKTPIGKCSVLTEEELKKAFSQICLYSCSNRQRPNDHPCIPFYFAEDGCFARAHAMRRILNEMGFECNKLFLYDNLNPKVNGECYQWKYHVAILLKVQTSDYKIKEVIIDPSLRPDQPISVREWTDLCYSTDCPKDKRAPERLGKEEWPGDTFCQYSDGKFSGYISDYNNYLMTDFVCKYIGTPNWDKRLALLAYNKIHNIPFNEEEFK